MRDCGGGEAEEDGEASGVMKLRSTRPRVMPAQKTDGGKARGELGCGWRVASGGCGGCNLFLHDGCLE